MPMKTASSMVENGGGCEVKQALLVEVMFRNPFCNVGGTELFFRNQLDVFEREGFRVLTIFPVKINKGVLRKLTFWGVAVDREFVAILDSRDLFTRLLEVREKYDVRTIIIQHLMRVDLDELLDILSVFGKKDYVVYLHDFYTACLQFNLMKNKKNFCGSAVLSEEKCSGCSYYPDSIGHKKRIEGFLRKLDHRDLTFVAPSDIVAGLWSEAYPEYKDAVRVIGHLMPAGCYRREHELSGRIKIAYIGATSTSKGWDAWRSFMDDKDVSSLYDLYYFGSFEPDSDSMTKITVKPDKSGKSTMVEMLRKNPVDIIVLNSTCPETYSYAYFESAASDTMLITNRESGNIAILTERNGSGKILDRADDLKEYLRDPETVRKDLLEHYGNDDRFSPEVLKKNEEYLSLIRTSPEDDGKNEPTAPGKHLYRIFRRPVAFLYKKKYSFDSFRISNKEIL